MLSVRSFRSLNQAEPIERENHMYLRISVLICFLLLTATSLVFPQEARVNQKKIEREREKKHKKDLKAYNDAVKRHNKMQSKSTRASMKKTKKEAKRATPVNR